MESSETRTKKTRTQMTREQRAENQARILAQFNKRFPVGTVVWYWLTLASGSPVFETKIRNEFFILPQGQSNAGLPVTFVARRSGYVSAWHITEVDEARRAELKPQVIHGEGQGNGQNL